MSNQNKQLYIVISQTGKLREYVSNTCSEGICEDATNRAVHRRLP